VDGAALAVIDSTVPLGIGVAHGHRATGRRVRVTRAEGSIVHELDGQPAWKRYAQLTRDLGLAAQGVDPDTITDAGARLQFFAWYQTGINLGDSYKNRTPLGKLADDSMAFACGIPEGTELEVLQSTTEAQVESAREAARQAAAKLGDHKVSGALVFECACRQVYLGDRFGEAPRAVSLELGGAPLAGLEAYGEVALNVGDFSGFHNATTVVLAFPEAS
jgi:methyl-accepting chemotaxis protein